MAYNEFMYVLAHNLAPLPIISLQTGLTVATTSGLIIDPGSLEVIAFTCLSPERREDLALILRDIRELGLDCLIIDSEDELVEISEVVRLKELWDRRFTLIACKVVSDMGRGIGTVEDYTVNLDTNKVQKIYVRQSVFKSLFGSSLIIDRTQIVDVAPKRIIVREASLAARSLGPKPMPGSNG